ncbi:MAG: MATE family efflux transporter [Spirochaetaceae bacterium]|jgi:putative MATE family efflux protein|nr:MATE family efflux transporter [Spirochaetaceae bacterium]
MSEILDTKPNEHRQPDAANRLGVEPIGRLLLKFSIPAISGMLLTALYNVVDRAFVGHGVHELALGGLSLVLPLQTLSMAFAMLFGIGAANMISMRLGQRRVEEAEKALNHCFWLLLISGLIITIAELALLDPLLTQLGAQEGSDSINYARKYYRIILIGNVFFVVGFGLSHSTRAQGLPMISMIGMFIGAGLNLILDPIFIFVCDWGVEGAAIATIISQFCSTAWMLYFNLGKKAVIKLKILPFHPSAKIIISIMSFGSAQFLLQFVISFVQLLLNKSMGWYGVESLGVANGGDIAVSGMNIVGTLSMLILMPVFGLNQGAQPILGFNYGAKKFDRVRKTFILSALGASCICFVGFLFAEIFPRFLVGMFVSNGSAELVMWTIWAIRVSSIFLPLNGFQIISANMFVVTGRPKTSIFLAMMRQVIVLIPFLLILGKFFGIYGVVSAIPVADGVSAMVTSVMIFLELKKLKKQSDGTL